MTQQRRLPRVCPALLLLFLLVAVVLSRTDTVSTAKEIKEGQNHRREDVGGLHMMLDSPPLDASEEEPPLSGPWPKCQGLPAKTCVGIVEEGSPDVVGNVVFVRPGEGITRDYNIHRVILYVDENDVVENVPNRG